MTSRSKGKAKGGHRYSDEERRKLLADLDASGLSIPRFAEKVGIHNSIFYKWIKDEKKKAEGLVGINGTADEQSAGGSGAEDQDEAQSNGGNGAHPLRGKKLPPETVQRMVEGRQRAREAKELALRTGKKDAMIYLRHARQWLERRGVKQDYAHLLGQLALAELEGQGIGGGVDADADADE